MAKRGRPKKLESPIWDRKYYRLSDKRDNQAIRKVKEERMIKAYEYLHLMAYDEPLRSHDINPMKSKISDILDRI